MKRTLLFLFIIAFAYVSKAQNSQERFSIGVKGGYTSTRFDLDNYEQRFMQVDDRNYKSGFLAGMYTRVTIFKGLSFQPEFYYASKKGEISISSVNNELTFPDTSFVTSVKSFDLPLLVRLRLLNFDVGNIYAIGGPVVSFTKEGSADPDLMEYEFNKSNWTMMVGGGVEFWRVFVDARYEWSLSNSAASKSPDLGEMFYNMLTVSVGFKIFGI
jgi:hypothetical protein